MKQCHCHVVHADHWQPTPCGAASGSKQQRPTWGGIRALIQQHQATRTPFQTVLRTHILWHTLGDQHLHTPTPLFHASTLFFTRTSGTAQQPGPSNNRLRRTRPQHYYLITATDLRKHTPHSKPTHQHIQPQQCMHAVKPKKDGPSRGSGAVLLSTTGWSI